MMAEGWARGRLSALGDAPPRARGRGWIIAMRRSQALENRAASRSSSCRGGWCFWLSSPLPSPRTEVTLARNLVEDAKAGALAAAGVNRAIAGLMEGDTASPWREDGTVYAWVYGGGEVRISVRDEGGKLDLNRAPDRQLVGLFRAAGLPYGPKDASFEALKEPRRVLGMTPDLYRRVAPALTLYAGRDPPFEPTAPPEVRAFYGTLDVAGAGKDGPASQRDREARKETVEPLSILEEGPSTSRSRVPVYTVHAEGRVPGGAVFAREAVVRLTAGADSP